MFLSCPGGIVKNNRTFSATRKTTMKLVPAAYQKADEARGINAGDLTGNYYLNARASSTVNTVWRGSEGKAVSNAQSVT